MKEYIINLIAAAALISSSPCFAKCEYPVNFPSEQLSLTFKKNESALAPSDVEKLREWANSMNAKYPVQQWLSIGAHAQPDEDMPDTLASARGVAIAKLALDDGLVKAPIEIRNRVGSFGNPASYSDDARTVILQLSPGCPDNCCDRK
jgi:hypothetical protein